MNTITIIFLIVSFVAISEGYRRNKCDFKTKFYDADRDSLLGTWYKIRSGIIDSNEPSPEAYTEINITEASNPNDPRRIFDYKLRTILNGNDRCNEFNGSISISYSNPNTLNIEMLDFMLIGIDQEKWVLWGVCSPWGNIFLLWSRTREISSEVESALGHVVKQFGLEHVERFLPVNQTNCDGY